MARTKKTVKPDQVLEGLGDFNQFVERVEKPKEPIITSITLSQTGTIYGLSDNKIYFYDDIERIWRAL